MPSKNSAAVSSWRQLAAGALLLAAATIAKAEESPAATDYGTIVSADTPAAWWRFEGGGGEQSKAFNATMSGEVDFDARGPRPDDFPLFSAENRALFLEGSGGFLRAADPGESSPLDFTAGDSITLEAWIAPESLADGRYVYIVGKGRTNNSGFRRENQNYALRLSGEGGTARPSFLFRAAEDRAGEPKDFHRWTASVGFLPGDGWHHVAVAYTFGKGDSLRGYLDGREIPGTWDMGGKTDRAPVVDDDELWIGSSMGGQSGSTFHGRIDEVAIYRSALSAERIAARFVSNRPGAREAELADGELPADAALVELIEGIPSADALPDAVGTPSESFTLPVMTLIDVPQKYNSQAIIVDRTNPFLVRMRLRQKLAPGNYELLLRAKNATRLHVDGRLVAQTGFLNRNSSGHEEVPDLADPQYAGLWPLAPGHQEQIVSVELDEGEHVFRVETIVGGKNLRAELGELCIGIAAPGEPFDLLTAPGAAPIPLTAEGWRRFAREQEQWKAAYEAGQRREQGSEEAEYWSKRHELAREIVLAKPAANVPEISAETPANNDVDRFIGAKMEAAGASPSPLTDDYAFLRRVTLDTVGVIPTPEEIDAFLAGGAADRRARAIDRLLADDRWADHWTSYWQDVLAENPGILKPELNNTGPFRVWIYESLLDNKPFDRFVTELVLMEGSKYGGGPAGFAMATQNDVPMAAKAHVLAQAFLGLEMKCARCHDAPFHDFAQHDLFSVAALLEKKPIALPVTSTVPKVSGREVAVESALSPGETIEPEWPFQELAPAELPAGILRSGADSRRRLAAIITSPNNERLPKVVVNRLWKQLFGWGIVEPVDDWEDAEPSHPALLDYLARELVLSGYDLKHVARLILNSHAYQRQATAEGSKYAAPKDRSFAAPARRRMTAEQIVDSLLAAAGKPPGAEMLTFDPEGRRPQTSFLNLGVPRRAWQFTSLSNERDRPALALPAAQTIVDVLVAFGWRDARPNPQSVRDDTATAIQPLTLANGILTSRVTRLSDDSAFTEIALAGETAGDVVEQAMRRVLSRPATEEEREMLIALLEKGFSDRVIAGAEPNPPANRPRTTVSWSNHLSAEATRIKLELERLAREGDAPSARLRNDWRERMEDLVWALVNSPEFVFVP